MTQSIRPIDDNGFVRYLLANHIPHRFDAVNSSFDVLHGIVNVRAKAQSTSCCSGDSKFLVHSAEHVLSGLGGRVNDTDAGTKFWRDRSDQIESILFSWRP